jgi:ABC-2 type transport system ATP-binding protein
VTSAIELVDVRKRFRLYHEKSQSLKERIIRAGRNPSEDFWALGPAGKGVTLDVPEGQTVGLLGHNGSGKSTLFKCVAGTLRPTAGTIRTRGRIARLLELGSGFHPDLTGRENVYLNGSILGFSASEIDEIFDEIVDFAEIPEFIDLQVKHYSSGMYARLAFAVAVNVTPDIMLIDEVLSVGDEMFQRKCIDRVKRFQTEGRTIFLVTHAADLVRQLCSRAAVLDHGEMLYDGEPADAVRVYREALRARGLEIPEEAAERELTREIEIGAVRLELPGSDGRAYLQAGEPLRLVIPYRAQGEHDDVVFAFHLIDADGNLVFGTNSEIVEDGAHRVDGSGEYVFELAALPLHTGTFFLDVGVHTAGGLEYDHRARAVDFQVSNTGPGAVRSIGKVFVPTTGRHHSEPNPNWV